MKIAICLFSLLVSALAEAALRTDAAPTPQKPTAIEVVNVLLENGSIHADRASLLTLQHYLDEQPIAENGSAQEGIELALRTMQVRIDARDAAAALVSEAMVKVREARTKACCGGGGG